MFRGSACPSILQLQLPSGCEGHWCDSANYRGRKPAVLTQPPTSGFSSCPVAFPSETFSAGNACLDSSEQHDHDPVEISSGRIRTDSDVNSVTTNTENPESS